MNGALEGLQARLRELDTAFRERSMRERVMLVACAVALVFVALDNVGIQPIVAERRSLDVRIATREAEIPGLEGELALLTQVTMTPEERRIADERAQIERQLEQIELRMTDSLEALVPPEEIVGLLEQILAATPSLRLVQLESRPPEELGAREQADRSATPVGSGLFRHGLRIELEGSYPATLRYLERLEKARWNLLWDRFDYQVQLYPKGRATIDLHTISDRKEWIGV